MAAGALQALEGDLEDQAGMRLGADRADGAEALQIYERAMRSGESFQAVILDATIRGGMGGVATIERLRDLDPNVTAIICSGYSDEAALAEFLTYGFRAALPKPFTRHELANVLQRAFETSQTE